MFRSKFKCINTKMPEGYTGKYLQIPNPKRVVGESDVTKLRREIQNKIKNLIEKNKSLEEIYNELNQDDYRPYEQYFSIWIEDWIIKLKPNIKTIVMRGLNRNKTQEEIIQELEELNSEEYTLYKEKIQNKINREIELKKEKTSNEKAQIEPKQRQEEEER